MAYPELNRIVELERATTTRNSVNAPVQSWGPAAGAGLVAESRRYAHKQDVKDGERVRNSEPSATIDTRFQLHYDTLTSTMDPTWRLKCEGKTYEISGIKELGFHERIEVSCTRRAENPA